MKNDKFMIAAVKQNERIKSKSKSENQVKHEVKLWHCHLGHTNLFNYNKERIRNEELPHVACTVVDCEAKM